MAPRPLPNEKELILLREKIARDRFDPEISQATEEETKLELDRLKRDIELLENPETIFSFGVMTYDEDGVTQDYGTAAGWFKIAAEQGHAEAQHNLALMLEEGRGIATDLKAAAFWYQKAAEQGNPNSQNNLAGMYETGSGVAKDFAEAIKWYLKAAANGNATAALNLKRVEKASDAAFYAAFDKIKREAQAAEDNKR